MKKLYLYVHKEEDGSFTARGKIDKDCTLITYGRDEEHLKEQVVDCIATALEVNIQIWDKSDMI